MMVDKLEEATIRVKEIETDISNPEVIRNAKRYKKLMQEHASLRETVEVYQEYKKTRQELGEAEQLLSSEKDPDIREMAKEEIENLESREEELEHQLKVLLIPKDPMDRKNIIMEIRAGTGGEEAALFASDLFRMYSKYTETRRWKIEVLSSSETGIGGFKEIKIGRAHV